jgi:hypothetical protein
LEDRWCPSSLVPPHVTTNPADLTVNARHIAIFTAAASGTPSPSVQWEVSSDAGKTFQNIPGAKAATLQFAATPAENGYEYEAVFTNKAGQATTNHATLTVDFAPIITTQPPSKTVVATGTQATLAAAASSNPIATVQWQVSTNGGKTFSNVPGGNSPTLTFTAPAKPGIEEFRAVFTNSLGAATTKVAVVMVDVPPAVTANPANVVVTANPANVTVKANHLATFTASASGKPAPSAQWQVSTDGGKTFKNLAGRTSDALTFVATAKDNGSEYRAVFTNPLGKVTTNAATLTVH